LINDGNDGNLTPELDPGSELLDINGGFSMEGDGTLMEEETD